MPRVAFFTYNVLRERRGHPRIREFEDMGPEIVKIAEQCAGFLGYRTGRRELSPIPRPSFFNPDEHADEAQTLSFCSDLESVSAFAYEGLHARALQLKREWFIDPAWPVYTAWWIEDNEQADWQEAIRRLEYLHHHGPTPCAFTFKSPFNATGQPTALDQDRIRALRAQARKPPS
jgi:hypothetical protein